MPITFNTQHKKHLFSGKYDLSFSLSSKLQAGELSSLIHECCNELMTEGKHFHNHASQPELIEARDLKGQTLSGLGTNLGPDHPAGDEILAVIGQLYSKPQQKLEPDAELALYLTSRFSRFENEHHILHQVEKKLVGLDYYLPTNRALELVGRAPGFMPTKFRLNFDLFTSQRMLLLGFSPRVFDTLRIGATLESFELAWHSKDLPSLDLKNSRQSEVLGGLQKVLMAVFGFSLLEKLSYEQM